MGCKTKIPFYFPVRLNASGRFPVCRKHFIKFIIFNPRAVRLGGVRRAALQRAWAMRHERRRVRQLRPI